MCERPVDHLLTSGDGHVAITKEFRDEKPSTWLQATSSGRRAFANYLANLEKVLKWVPPLPRED